MNKKLACMVLALLAGCTATKSQKAKEPLPAPSTPATSTPSPAPSPSPKKPDCVKMTATTEPEGLKEEGRWLHDHYPGWKKVSQSLSLPPGPAAGQAYDYLEIVTPDGLKHSVCFDISSYLGKF